MPARTPSEIAAHPRYTIEYQSGDTQTIGKGPPAFTISVRDEAQLQKILQGGAYSAALEFIEGRFHISGDLIAALRFRQEQAQTGWVHHLSSLAARFAPARLETWFQSRKKAARNIRFHYDVSNEFYRTFLDSRLVYSEGLFENPSLSLDQAQEAKLKKICEDLKLRPGERFLDVGCGWGGLVTYAAERYGVDALGCTLSHNQAGYARELIRAHGVEGRAAVRETDYRDLRAAFDKISSIGMFEHVGRNRLRGYFRKIHSLLKAGGLFLNSGIVRPENVTDDAETWFLMRKVFPGGELVHLSDVIRAAERAGFHVTRVESLPKHYARTCREWVNRLYKNQERCLSLVGQEIYRTWLLYLAASAMNFEDGTTNICWVMMRKA